MSLLKNVFKLIPTSMKDAAGRVSSARIQSYGLLALIWLCVLVFLAMEILRAIETNIWEVSDTMEQVFFALLAHHVVMLGVTKNAKSEPRGDLFKKLPDEDTEEESSVEIESTPTTVKVTKKTSVVEKTDSADQIESNNKNTEDLI